MKLFTEIDPVFLYFSSRSTAWNDSFRTAVDKTPAFYTRASSIGMFASIIIIILIIVFFWPCSFLSNSTRYIVTSLGLQLLLACIIFQILVSGDCGSFDESCIFQFSYCLVLYFLFEIVHVFSIFPSIKQSIPDHWPSKIQCSYFSQTAWEVEFHGVGINVPDLWYIHCIYVCYFS